MYIFIYGYICREEEGRESRRRRSDIEICLCVYILYINIMYKHITKEKV